MQQYTLNIPLEEGEEIRISIPVNATFAQLDKATDFIKYVKKQMLQNYKDSQEK